MGDMRTRQPPTGRSRADHEMTPGQERSAFEFRQDARNSGGDRDESIPGLLRELIAQGSHLAEQQTKLVQAEVRSAVRDVTAAGGAIAAAGVVGIAALGVFLMGLAYLLDEIMPLWAATLLVAVATMGIAYALFASGRAKLRSSSLELDHTRHTIQRAPTAIAGNHNQEHSR